MYIDVSPEFKKKSSSAIVAIVFFVIVYILLFLAAIGLMVACMYGGIAIFIFRPSIITGGVGLGLASLGIIVMYFLIKFLFKKHTEDRSHLMEIKRNEESELFALIDEIVKEAETDFPRRVYLAYDVNASVFYDSSFWSMFLPIKKNLTIGAGLVNTTTRQELKAILAHEFGHFSQRSMKVGSYVYNVNRIIFNLVNNDEPFNKTIEGWANASGYFAIFVIIAAKIIQGVQWILGKMYSLVNIRHMALSREMEFHADEVAANIAGSLPLEESLLRIEIASNAYNSVISFYENKITQKEDQISNGIYQEQSFVMNFLAKESEIAHKNDLPKIELSDAGLFNKSKLTIENQWASHPSDEERISRLQKLNIVKEYDNRLAKTLFKNFEQTEKQLTKKLFSSVENVKNMLPIQLHVFENDYIAEYRNNTFDPVYNNYYDEKNPIPFDVEKNSVTLSQANFEELFSKDKVEAAFTLIALNKDKAIIQSIANNETTIKTFDYDGKKYTKAEAEKLIRQLESQIKELESQIAENDIGIYKYFYMLAYKKNDTDYFKKLYSSYFDFDNAYEEKYNLYVQLSNSLHFITQTTSYEDIRRNFRTIFSLESKLKEELKFILGNLHLASEFDLQNRKDLEYYVQNELTYFNNNEYIDTNLQSLFLAVNSYHFYLGRLHFLMRKKILDYQANLQAETLASAV